MSIANMHYDFKQKLNKIDSQKYRNLRVPEIDWKLNEALGIFVKTIAQPRMRNQLGFEINKRTIEDIRELVKERYSCTVTAFGDSKSFRAELPTDYWYLAATEAFGTKGTCGEQKLETVPVQHDDRHEESPFDNSNFEWRTTNYRFYSEGLRFYTDGTFTIDKIFIDYIIKPKYMHLASAVPGGMYKLPDGTELTGKEECQLSNEIVQREIVDLAVLITTGDLKPEDYQVKMAKVKMND